MRRMTRKRISVGEGREGEGRYKKRRKGERDDVRRRTRRRRRMKRHIMRYIHKIIHIILYIINIPKLRHLKEAIDPNRRTETLQKSRKKEVKIFPT